MTLIFLVLSLMQGKAAGVGGSKGVLPTRSSPRKYGFVMGNASKSIEGMGGNVLISYSQILNIKLSII